MECGVLLLVAAVLRTDKEQQQAWGPGHRRDWLSALLVWAAAWAPGGCLTRGRAHKADDTANCEMAMALRGLRGW